MPQLYLGSRSPRRRELLKLLQVEFDILAADIDETPALDEPPVDCVRRLAEQKAEAVRNSLSGSRVLPVLASDTIVVLDNQILGKPVDEAQAVDMLRHLSGRDHRVMTAIAMVDDCRADSLVQTSEVSFAKLSEAEIERYVASGEPADKAGAYAIQGLAGAFVRELRGSYSGVMGLPLYETREMLRDFGIIQ